MTKPSDRERVVDRLLASTRRDPTGPAAGVCLDADTLAAWAEGTLSADEQAAAERHAAGCGRCQAVLAAMVRTEPQPPARVRQWSPWAAVRWAVPLTAAAAVALWVAVDRDVARQPVNESISQVPVSPAPAPPAAATAPPQAASGGETDTRARDAARPGEVRGERRARPAAPPVEAPSDAPARAVPELLDARAAPPAPAAKAQAPAAESLPPPVAVPPAPSAAAAPQVAKQLPPPSQSAAEQMPGGGVAETVTTNAAAVRRMAATDALARVAWIDVVSPDPLVRWRFSPAGDVERSADAGVTWTREPIGSGAMLVAGAAPSSSVCWLAGRAGTVLRFTTARGWQRFTVLGRPDLVAIDATDAETATVTLTNGRRLTTKDGGATWR